MCSWYRKEANLAIVEGGRGKNGGGYKHKKRGFEPDYVGPW